MDDKQTEQVIRLLEEIRDGQRLQLERQALALERQAVSLTEQRERLAALSKGTAAAEGIENQAKFVLTKSTNLIGDARLLLILAFLVAVPLLVFMLWAFAAHGAA